ncbi:MAG: hypothetical protein KAR42_17385 [candidate division Zixibacteria bacterium]|nr:hypothetical protein [candidate division Zixibacteria bacterium]
MAVLLIQAKSITCWAFLLLLLSFFQADLAEVSAQSKLDFLGQSPQATEKSKPEYTPVSSRNLRRKSTTTAGIKPSTVTVGSKVQVISSAVQSGPAGKNSSYSSTRNRPENPNLLNRKSSDSPTASPSSMKSIINPTKTTRSPGNLPKKPIGLMSVDYRDMPFQDVINDIRSRLGINILVYWPALEQMGIERDIPVTMKLSNITPGKILTAVLDYVAGGTGQTLGMEVDRGVLEINLKENLGQRLEVKTYYVGDLLHQPSPGYSMSMYSGGMSGMGSTGGMGTMGQMGFQSGFGGSRGFGTQGSRGGQNRRGFSQRTRSNRPGY